MNMYTNCVENSGLIADVVSRICNDIKINGTNAESIGASIDIKANDLQFALSIMTNFYNDCNILYLVEFVGLTDDNRYILVKVTFHIKGGLKMK